MPRTNKGDSTVYTVYAGFLPTLGFSARDLKVDKKTAGRAYTTAGGATKYSGNYVHTSGKGSGLGSIVGRNGELVRGRIRGSVAWFEYSTTIRAINELRDKSETNLDMHRQISDAAGDFYAGEGLGSERWRTSLVNSVISDLISESGQTSITPTGETAQGGPGQPGEQAASGRGGGPGGWQQGFTMEHPSDSELRAQGRLVGQANAIDIYMRGRDGSIYRLDVTSQTMGDSKAHHGLTDEADRVDQGVTSDQLLDTIGQPATPGGQQQAQDDLYKYFVNTQEGWNTVIKGLKSYADPSGNYLHLVNLDDPAELESIREQLREAQEATAAGQRAGGRGKATGKGSVAANKATSEADRRDVLSVVRQAKPESERRLASLGISISTIAGTNEAMSSAISFALHMLGNITNFMEPPQGYSSEYRISGDWVAEVKHIVYATGANIMEFMPLIKNESVLLHNAASLQEVYQRMMMENWNGNIDLMVKATARGQNQDQAAYVTNFGRESIEIGSIVDAGYLNTSGPSPTMHGKTIIMPEDMNEHIDHWIQNVGTGRGWRQAVEPMLRRHIRRGRMISGQTQQSAPVRLTGEGALEDTDFSQWLSASYGVGHGQNPETGEPSSGIHGVRADNLRLLGDRMTNLGAFGGFGSALGTGVPIATSSQSGQGWYQHAGTQIQNPRLQQARSLLKGRIMGRPGQKSYDKTTRKHTPRDMDQEWENLERFLTKGSTPLVAGRGGELADLTLMGMSQARGVMTPLRMLEGELTSRGGKFWGLDEYLSREEQTSWDDNVNPYFWAAPYFSILYPSGQMQTTSA